MIKDFRAKFIALMLCCSVFGSFNAVAQCPLNIDFEAGDFTNWLCYKGTVADSSGVNLIRVSPTAPVSDIHQIIPRSSGVDPYGGFPTTPPDGSNYVVKLGNNGTGAHAERISYTFTIPNDQTDFVITYQYAVVLQNPNHSASQQPRFKASVYDVTLGQYIDCGTFDYVATAGLPGFQRNGAIVYKSWTPANINLYGYQGHTVRLEFTSADCTKGGHFGYAYIDVNNICSKLIQGSEFCSTESMVTLTGPGGYDKYQWYNEDRSVNLGTGQSITIPTAGAENKRILLDIVPYDGFGCPYTTDAVLHSIAPFAFQINNPPPACLPATVDLTAPAITTGTDPGTTFSYFTDATATVQLESPSVITQSGTYYIKAVGPSGCYDIKPVVVTVNPTPLLNVTNPATTCLSTPVDLTAAQITAGSDTNGTLSYWKDAAASIPLPTPQNVTTAGTYYIQLASAAGCSMIKPVTVTFFALPNINVNNPAPVCFPNTINITTAQTTSGSDANLAFTYWKDAAATIALSAPETITQSGTYYIKGTNQNNCETIKEIVVTINPLPNLMVTAPSDVCLPETIDLTRPQVTSGSSNINNLSYWRDAGATILLNNPNKITESGTYYIKATNSSGCEVIKEVVVGIHQNAVVSITNPARVVIPASVDLTLPAVTAGSSAGLNYSYYTDAAGNYAISDPKHIDKSGTYYIKGTNQYGCFAIQPVEVKVVDIPKILVPSAFTPTLATNNRLYPFMVGIKIFKAFKVFDRWGILVFQAKDPSPENGWDGMYRGELHFMETYTWYAEGVDYSDNLIQKSGNTILLK